MRWDASRTCSKAVTSDPAMLLFLSLADSDKEAPNENYARELMELFTLGHGYSERDIRQAARALTGFRVDWDTNGPPRCYYSKEAHDTGVKRIFGHAGHHDWQDVLRLCVSHPAHGPRSSWGSCGTTSWIRRFPVTPATTWPRSTAAPATASSPWSGTILAHPALYRKLDAPGMVKSPVVYLAGALRSAGQESTAMRGHTSWRTWGSTRSTHRRSPGGTGARHGSRRTRCTSASTRRTT